MHITRKVHIEKFLIEGTDDKYMVCEKCGKEIHANSDRCSCGGKAVQDEWGVLQIETTGLHPELGDEILKIVIMDKRGDVILNRLYRPACKRSWDEAEKINHIKPQDVAGCNLLKGEEIKNLSKLYFSRFTKLVTNDSSFVKPFFRLLNVETPSIVGISGLFEDYLMQKNELGLSKGLKSCAQYFHYDNCAFGKKRYKEDKAYQIWYCYRCITGFNKEMLFEDMRKSFTVNGVTYETFMSEEQILEYLKLIQLCPLLEQELPTLYYDGIFSPEPTNEVYLLGVEFKKDDDKHEVNRVILCVKDRIVAIKEASFIEMQKRSVQEEDVSLFDLF